MIMFASFLQKMLFVLYHFELKDANLTRLFLCQVVNTDKEQAEVQEEIQNIVKDTIKTLSSNAVCDTLWTDNFETYV